MEKHEKFKELSDNFMHIHNDVMNNNEHSVLITRFSSHFCSHIRSDPAMGTWATTWMSGIALAVLVISLISGAIFALYWARKNKRNMKAAYPGTDIQSYTIRRFYGFSEIIYQHANYFRSS